MKSRILLLVVLFFAMSCAYSQHISNAMPVDIPLNSTKESAIKKLLNNNYQLYDTYDQKENGYLILYYKQKYDGKMIGLWLKNGRVSIVEWVLSGGLRVSDIESELKVVYDITPYAETIVSLGDPSKSLANEYENYFYWKGNTLVTNSSLINSSLYFLSNDDAAKRYQESIQKAEKQKQELKEKERLAQEREQKERQERIRKENEQKERERKEAEEKQRKAHIESLKSTYSSCRFLFATDERFVSCITQKDLNTIENEIKTLIDLKMDELSNIVVKGTEFKDQHYARISMEEICDIPNSMKSVSPTIANYAENKILTFVTERKKINKAYKKAKKTDPNLKCSMFLNSYIKGNGKTSNNTGVIATIATLGTVAVIYATIYYLPRILGER